MFSNSRSTNCCPQSPSAHTKSEFTKNFEYKIGYISKTKNRNLYIYINVQCIYIIHLYLHNVNLALIIQLKIWKYPASIHTNFISINKISFHHRDIDNIYLHQIHCYVKFNIYLFNILLYMCVTVYIETYIYIYIYIYV